MTSIEILERLSIRPATVGQAVIFIAAALLLLAGFVIGLTAEVKII